LTIKQIETELRLRGFSPKTIENYVMYNQLFLDHIKKDPEEITIVDVKEYLGFLLSEKNYKPKSMNLVISALRFYYQEILKTQIFLEIKSMKVPKKIPIILSETEIKKFLSSTKNFKHKLIFETMYGLGLRVSELTSLKVKDFDKEKGICNLRDAKGGKDRIVPVSSKLMQKIDGFLDSERKFLFITKRGGPYSIKTIQKLVKEIAERAGLDKNVKCHMFRSSFATHLLEAGIDIRYIQAILGHANISTTEVYTKVNLERNEAINAALNSIHKKLI
jgi:integrase/recombinase XerD